MREIKFRAWDGKNKFMLDSSYGDWVCFDGIPYTEADKKYNTPNMEIEKAKEYILMQYTGLKDKNGKDIYEGDILRLLFDNESTDIGKLWYMAPTWKIKSFTKPGSYDLVDWGYGVTMNKTEVIGNIYENPELITP